jgi:hypothetical protein
VKTWQEKTEVQDQSEAEEFVKIWGNNAYTVYDFEVKKLIKEYPVVMIAIKEKFSNPQLPVDSKVIICSDGKIIEDSVDNLII